MALSTTKNFATLALARMISQPLIVVHCGEQHSRHSTRDMAFMVNLIALLTAHRLEKCGRGKSNDAIGRPKSN